MKINVGCGARLLEGYLNTDVRPVTGVDAVCSAWNLPAIVSDVEELRSHDVIEHLFPKDWPRTLDEFWRVLKPGGTLLLSTPDFGEIAAGYTSGKYTIDDVRKTVLATVPPFNSCDYDVPESYHRTAHSEASLRADLAARGFVDIKTWRGPTYTWELFVEARKPPAVAAPDAFTVVIPELSGYPYAESFREVAEAVHHGLRALGYSSELAVHEHPVRQNILFGAHFFPDLPIPPGTIVYNLEQHESQMFNITRDRVLRNPRVQVWDFSKSNLEAWRNVGISAKHVPIGFVPELARITPTQEQDIDVFFYGSENPRRLKILDDLRAAGLTVTSNSNIFGAARDSLIARSKVVLNMHYYETKIFQTPRVSYLLTNSVCVVSEESNDDEGFEDACLFAPYERLVESCQLMVSSGKWRRAQGVLGRKIFQENFDEAAILLKALSMPDPAQPVLSDNGSMLGRWTPWYGSGHRANYGPSETYHAAELWLANLHVEDWGCGYAQFKDFHEGEYVGVDGTPGWADTIADLREHTSTTDGLLLRHVLEHNPDWRRVLKNAVASFRKRMVLVVFTPDSGTREDKSLAFVSAVNVHDLSLPFAEIESFFSECRLLDKKHFPTATGYEGETVWFIEK